MSRSLPSQGWLERPWPRRSWAMARKPCAATKCSWSSQASAVSGQPWLNTTGWPAAPVLVEDLGAVVGVDERHAGGLSFDEGSEEAWCCGSTGRAVRHKLRQAHTYHFPGRHRRRLAVSTPAVSAPNKWTCVCSPQWYFGTPTVHVRVREKAGNHKFEQIESSCLRSGNAHARPRVHHLAARWNRTPRPPVAVVSRTPRNAWVRGTGAHPPSGPECGRLRSAARPSAPRNER